MSTCRVRVFYIFIITNLVNIATRDVVSKDIKTITHKLVSEFNGRSIPERLPVSLSDKNVTDRPNYSNKTFQPVSGEHNIIMRIYAGAVARLPCKLHVPILHRPVAWLYAETNIKQLQDEAIVNEHNLTIYNVRREHEGRYRCTMDGRFSGNVTLEVMDDDRYNVVKPVTSKGPYAMEPESLTSSLVMYSVWSDWSECSKCGVVGRRRRYGVCYVAQRSESKPSNNNSSYINEETNQLFKTYPGGIPCRSPLLPPSIRDIRPVQNRPNEIMLGLCKVKCKQAIVKIRSKSGEIIEMVNNTAGIYSLHQKTPPQPPLPTRRIIYAEPGEKTIVTCSGTTLRDIPFSWRADSREISPRYLYATSGGRVHLNARDHIIFSHVLYSDGHTYSCWQKDILAGVVKLQVERSGNTTYRLRLRLLTFIIIAAILLRLTLRLVHYRQRYLGISI